MIVDWSLSDGKEFIQTVKPTPPIIILSGGDDSKSEIAALREAADDYLYKPFDLEVLLTRIEANLRRDGVSQPIGLTVC